MFTVELSIPVNFLNTYFRIIWYFDVSLDRYGFAIGLELFKVSDISQQKAEQ